MLKKMMLLAVSVGALAAFAAPAAQGQQLYEKNPFGGHEQLKTGALITATSTNLVTKVTVGTPPMVVAELTCALVTIHGEVTENKPNSVKIESNVVTPEGCNHAITPATVGPITIGPGTTGLAHDATFVSDHGCHYTGDIPFSYVHDTHTLTVTGTEQFTGTPAACGKGDMTGDFTLETPTTPNPTPVYME